MPARQAHAAMAPAAGAIAGWWVAPDGTAQAGSAVCRVGAAAEAPPGRGATSRPRHPEGRLE
eukprot:3543486-Alexandrium_andersonii.AAC.1